MKKLMVWVVETKYSDGMDGKSIFSTAEKAEAYLNEYRQKNKADIDVDTGDAVILNDGEFREIGVYEVQ